MFERLGLDKIENQRGGECGGIRGIGRVIGGEWVGGQGDCWGRFEGEGWRA